MDLPTLAAAAGLALVSTLSVGLWTLRVALAARGRRIAASVTASTEALLFVAVFGRVLDALDDPVRVAGYAAGVAVGTFAGLTLEAGSERRRTTVGSGEPPDGGARSIDDVDARSPDHGSTRCPADTGGSPDAGREALVGIRSLIAIAVVASLAAGCASGEATEASNLVVDVENSRTAQIRGVLYARLVNDGDAPVEVTSLQLLDERFAEVPATPKSTTVGAGGDPVVTPFEYGDAVCDDGVSGPARLAVTVESGGEVDERILPVATAGEEALTQLHASTCRQRAAVAAADIRFGPD